MKIIGITGGIGSGKSYVLEMMKETYNAVICQTDLVAHQLQEKGKECYRKIVEEFGEMILTDAKEIDRKKLGEIVFNNADKLQKLNQIVHPAVKMRVKSEIERARKEKCEIFLIESALLMEDHYEEISRLMSDEKIDLVMKTQATEKVFRKYCHRTIDNSGTMENTKKQIEQAVNRR